MSPDEPSSARRHFLGWDTPPIATAVDWIAGRSADELEGLSIGLPSVRAVQAIEHQLARRLSVESVPPRVMTIERLGEQLLGVDERSAPQTARSLAWARALRELPESELMAIVARPPAVDAGEDWLRLAELVRGAFDELGAEGFGFERVLQETRLVRAPGERGRYEALAAAQGRMRTILAEAGLADPNFARLEALETREPDPDARVLLVGISDLDGLQRRTLAAFGERLGVLIFAPKERADDFDALGCLIVERWSTTELALPDEDWVVVQGPTEQAAAVVGAIAKFEGRFAAEEISIGVPDPEVVPYIQRRLAEEGIATRLATGEPLTRCPPARLVAALAGWLANRNHAGFAALVRHPDLELALRGRVAPDAIERLDAYQCRHLPARVDDAWLGKVERAGPLATLHRELVALGGPLTRKADRSQPRPLSEWLDALRAFLVRVYEPRLAAESDPDAQRALEASLAQLAAALDELQDLPTSLAPNCSPARALELVLRELRTENLAAPADDRPTIELLAWHELALDDAPALCVTGFVEGRVPEGAQADAFLPDALRRALGLVDDQRRLARELHAAHLMLHSRAAGCTRFISGRRSADGNPLLPSRLALRVPREVLAPRVQHWLRVTGAHLSPTAACSVPDHRLPRRAQEHELDSWTVSAFGHYLRSPYGFYLQHVLRLKTLDDRARELDPPAFGDLAHLVLQAFGEGALRDSTDPRAIERALSNELDELSRAQFGSAPLPAVAIQIEQLRRRLGHFARAQAERARQGWRIVHCEWQPAGESVALDVDDREVRVKGRIDRIDHHEQLGWAILDYKSGERAKDPADVHRSKEGAWLDLQLPLYRHLTSELCMEQLPRLGYVTLGGDAARVGFREVPREGASAWNEELLEGALESAREVVRKVRAGEFFDSSRGIPREPLLQAIAGIGLLEPAGGEELAP